jgi:carboxyl-terminal processing protease
MRNKNYWANIVSYGFLTISVSAFAFTIGYIRGVLIERESQGYGLLQEVRDLLSEYYIGDLPPQKTLEYGAVRGMITAVGDQYSIFLEPPAQELEAQSLQGEFGGIGVNIRRSEAGDIVLSPFPDYPAIKAGVQEGDILLEVDDMIITAEMPLDQVSVLVRGVIGSQVRILFQHGTDAPQEVTLTREKVEIPSVTSRILEQDPSVGLVTISRFSDKTANETRQAIENLQAQGAASLIIDLRGNGGGLLDAAVDTAKLFLDGGVIMYEDKHNEDEKIYEASTNSFASNIPLAIIVNHGTASASEILAGALHDRGRAPLIGQPTYGKGSVQLVFELSDHSSVHITNARWFTPGRLQIDGVGITPDIEVQPGTDGNDPELDRALEYLQNQN